jgi:prepilin-type N-terminal cleavage/methylation domain-containing protein
MKKQAGFTLIELAIVLVIIGLLLGGVLKGQELINSAKVKNMATDFKNIQVYIYGYQDKFKALPGDDRSAATHVGAAASTNGDGNGEIGGAWNSTGATESYYFWEHIRRAGLASGSTDSAITNTTYLPTNNEGGPVGIQSKPQNTIAGLTGSYAVCSGGIVGKIAKQLDVQMDDGDTTKGSVMVAAAVNGTTPATAVATTATDFDSTKYVVCVAF